MTVKQCLLFLLSVFIFVISTNIMGVSAINTDFSTEELSENDRITFISNIDISLLESEFTKKSIQCFDVSEEGLVAIGQKSGRRKCICIYSSEGVFQYGYTFDCTGSFGIEWDDENHENLNIYFVRSDVIISVSPSGEVLDVVEVQDTMENNSHRNYLLYSTGRTVGDSEYTVRNNMGMLNWMAVSYSQVVVTPPVGEERVIYDVSSTQLLKTVVIFVIIIVIVFIAAIAIALQLIKLRRGNMVGFTQPRP